jgi:hypothetical protein
MALDLPQPLGDYFAADAGDLHRLTRCFSEDAVVHDEGRAIRGRKAIQAWMEDAQRKYRHTAAPQSLTTKDDGRLVVSVLTSGDFPGSPVLLDHAFRVVDGQIIELEIR